MEQHHELGNYAFYLIGDENLVAIELDAVATELVVLDLWEVEDTCQMEWEINVKMNPEQRIGSHRVEVVIELEIFLILDVCWCLYPKRKRLVDLVILLSIHFLTVLPFGFLSKDNRNRQVTTILLQQVLNFVFVGELTLALIVEIEDNVGTSFSLITFIHCEVDVTFAGPKGGRLIFLPTLRANLYLLGYHERRIETKTEMTNDVGSIFLVFLEELGST